ncbi:hypothetical protein B0H13DRAFT_1909634 [Mycena leptocephala]|nr:hypothetical protein B0H13DRAFT_1909634 [Mycena leptocephala]
MTRNQLAAVVEHVITKCVRKGRQQKQAGGFVGPVVSSGDTKDVDAELPAEDTSDEEAAPKAGACARVTPTPNTWASFGATPTTRTRISLFLNLKRVRVGAGQVEFLRSCQKWQLCERHGHSTLGRVSEENILVLDAFFSRFCDFFDKFALSLGDL